MCGNTTREQSQDPELLAKVAIELDNLRRHETEIKTTGAFSSSSSSLSSSSSSSSSQHEQGLPFPTSCRQLLLQIRGNSRCIDCNRRNPDWCSVTYGVLLCVSCSGKHRGYGVHTSRVRSLYMDSWSHTHVLKMLEGGNDQLKQFYGRHGMDASTATKASTKASSSTGYDSSSGSESSDDSSGDSPQDMVSRRYHTKAARFYRQQLDVHVERICQQHRNGYQGRAASRNHQQQQQQQQSHQKQALPTTPTPTPIEVQ